jgi:hypothetical protein
VLLGPTGSLAGRQHAPPNRSPAKVDSCSQPVGERRRFRSRGSSVATASYLGIGQRLSAVRTRIQFRIQLSPDSCRNMRSVVPGQKSKMP